MDRVAPVNELFLPIGGPAEDLGGARARNAAERDLDGRC
jgi:hypothetical protein